VSARNATIALAFAAVVFGAGFFLGRGKKRVEVREVEKVRTVEVVREVKVSDRATARNVVRRKTTSKTPDGTTKTETVTTIGVTEREISTTSTAKTAEKHTERETARVESNPADWRVSALVGGQLKLSPISFNTLVYGAAVERRLLGPVWVGVWGISSGTAGVSLTLEF